MCALCANSSCLSAVSPGVASEDMATLSWAISLGGRCLAKVGKMLKRGRGGFVCVRVRLDRAHAYELCVYTCIGIL